ncbi:N-acetylmuramoyl-L-alanine amidase, partial [Clostridium sp. UBA6640]|uniref:N-acetylmuramoyl-L-alanine amidase n=1 Tax=Clostridium sp. UBA6640 TaxID=1946370 RepID=UPI0025C61BFB
MKIAIDCGHTLSGADYGAVGIKAESVLTREVGNRVISKLKALGHTVINCTIDTCNNLGESLAYRVNQANNNNVGLFISIHFNCFNGQAYGTEVFTWGAEQLQEATRILNNLVGLGYANRGIKDGSNLYVIRNTKAKAMLIECCFCDSKKDMAKYNAEKIANAIVEGITGKATYNNS